jgi:flagellar biosynthetic protein FliR
MELIIPTLLGFVLVLTRVSAFFVTIPIFSWPSIPASVKITMALLVTIFFATITPFPLHAEEINTMQAVILIVNEAIYGFALGLAATMLFMTVKIAGTIIEQEMGLNMAEIFDPMTGEPAQAISTFLEMVFILLLLSANIHHLFLVTVAKSYELFPLGSPPDLPKLLTGIINAGANMLLFSLKLAAPVLAASLILMVVLAIAARVMPDMDIFFMSFPLKIGLGIILIAFMLPYIDFYVLEFSRLMNKLLLI